MPTTAFELKEFFFFRSFCRKHGIQMIAYSPFGSPDLPWGEKLPHILTDPVLKRIAEKHERSTANVALRWLLQRGLATIPKVCVISLHRKIASEFEALMIIKIVLRLHIFHLSQLETFQNCT